jgi:transposase-like protein
MKDRFPQTLQEAIAYFADSDRTFSLAVTLRWPPSGKVDCPRCLSKNHSFIRTRRIWFCYDCRKQFTLKVKTIFEDSPMGLGMWMTAIWMLANCKNGVSSHELARTLGITQRSAWYMLHRIWHALREGMLERGKLDLSQTWSSFAIERLKTKRRITFR